MSQAALEVLAHSDAKRTLAVNYSGADRGIDTAPERAEGERVRADARGHRIGGYKKRSSPAP